MTQEAYLRDRHDGEWGHWRAPGAGVDSRGRRVGGSGVEGLPLAFVAITDILDLERYPLHEPDSPAVAALLDQGRETLARDALFTLPGFVRPAAVEAMAGELEARVPVASRLEIEREIYPYEPEAWPQDHPRNARHACRYHQVLNHQIANDSPLRRIFHWEPLRDFLRRLMGYETFHRSECPHLALTAKVAGPGDADGWHYDGNDVVFSVLLRAPEGGGVFEYAPNLRSESDQNWDAMAAVYAGSHNGVRHASLVPGDLNVFQGNRTLHRVTPVEGQTRRIVGLFCYDRDPGSTFGEAYIEELRRRTPGYRQPA